ncbi:MFS transporter [Betaproteobacteria bacterium LSUCC0117]|nr:MFS transporter [Betaproteobacteria bacterium LSUCC0117]
MNAVTTEPTNHQTQPTSGLPAALVVAAGIVAAMHVGKVAPAIPVLQAQLGLTLVQAGWLLSLSQMAGMLTAVLIGMVADGIGLRRSLLTGLTLLGSLSLLTGLATSASQLLMMRAIEGAAILMVIVPGPALLRTLVDPARLSSAMGFWGTFMPTGTAAALLLGPPLMAHAGWATWWTALGGLALLMAAVFALGIPQGASRAFQLDSRRLITVWRTPQVWRVALAFGCYSGQWLVVIGFLPTLLQGGGASAAAAGSMAAIASAANIAGNLVGGRLLQRGVRSQKVLTIGFAAMAIGAFVVFATPPATPVAVKLAAVLVFSGVGGMIPGSLFSLAVIAAPSEDTASTALGWTTQMSMLGQFCMPPVVAALATAQGGWALSWVVTGGLCLMGVGLVSLRRS